MGELAGATGAAPKYKFTPSGAPRPMKMGTILSPWRYHEMRQQVRQRPRSRDRPPACDT
jgi:hypothetical protein